MTAQLPAPVIAAAHSLAEGVPASRHDGAVLGFESATALTPIWRSDLRREGCSDADIRSDRRHGVLHNLRPGLYLSGVQASESTVLDRYRALVQGHAHNMDDGAVLSHLSAAVLHGLPLWNTPLKRVHVSRVRCGGGNCSSWVHAHVRKGSVPSTDVDGLPVTAVAWTVVDCARMLSFESGVVIADAARHRELVTDAELAAVIHASRGAKGIERARQVVAFADRRSESVGESRSRVVIESLGLPPMDLQYRVVNADGVEVARVDFAIPDLRIAGEFDGKVKYGRLLRPGESAGDVVFEEKRREDAIRDAQWDVVRWTWGEIGSPEFAGRWRRAIARARLRSVAARRD